MAIYPNDPASGINIRTHIAAAALSGMMASGRTFDAVEIVKAADSVIAELNKGSIGSITSTASVGAASSSMANKTLNFGTPRPPDLR